MTLVDFGKKPRSQMIKITIFISEICFDEFSSCNFLEFTEKVRFVEGVKFGEKSFFDLGFLGRRGLRFFLHIVI